jgi:hypothetical protein
MQRCIPLRTAKPCLFLFVLIRVHSWPNWLWFVLLPVTGHQLSLPDNCTVRGLFPEDCTLSIPVFPIKLLGFPG